MSWVATSWSCPVHTDLARWFQACNVYNTGMSEICLYACPWQSWGHRLSSDTFARRRLTVTPFMGFKFQYKCPTNTLYWRSLSLLASGYVNNSRRINHMGTNTSILPPCDDKSFFGGQTWDQVTSHLNAGGDYRVVLCKSTPLGCRSESQHEPRIDRLLNSTASIPQWMPGSNRQYSSMNARLLWLDWCECCPGPTLALMNKTTCPVWEYSCSLSMVGLGVFLWFAHSSVIIMKSLLHRHCALTNCSFAACNQPR